MATKAQERKALEQIRKIVEGLGENSYIGTAMEGVWEMAEENIENDFGNSAKWYIEKMYGYEEQIKELKQKLAESDKALVAVSDKLIEVGKQLEQAEKTAIQNRRDVKLETGNDDYYGPFKKITFKNDNGFMFITVAEKNGWTTSYKMEDLKTFTIG